MKKKKHTAWTCQDTPLQSLKYDAQTDTWAAQELVGVSFGVSTPAYSRIYNFIEGDRPTDVALRTEMHPQ
jgi:hypothetical protein